MRILFHFELPDGTRVGSYRVKDVGNNNHVGNLVVLGGKRFEIINSGRPTEYSEAFDKILIVWPHAV